MPFFRQALSFFLHPEYSLFPCGRMQCLQIPMEFRSVIYITDGIFTGLFPVRAVHHLLATACCAVSAGRLRSGLCDAQRVRPHAVPESLLPRELQGRA